LHKKTVSGGAGIDGIRAMSIHKSKGLQFHTVIVPYCDWDIHPRSGTTVWCGTKEGFYDLELFPVSYSKGMGDTIFAAEYKEETVQTWMDNLNILYVAFTRAERNLLILAQENEKLDSVLKITTVSDLLQISAGHLFDLPTDDGRAFEKGVLSAAAPAAEKTSDNLLKQAPKPYAITFVSETFKQGESIFKQSNQSREFVDPKARSKENYVAYGNIMHKLFEQIDTMDDIDRAIDNHISAGLMHPDESRIYREKVRSAIIESGVEDWFSGKYRNYPEATILTEENGELKQKRPDRVLVSGEAAIVIDFKFGESHQAHHKQVRQYMDLLENMAYPSVEGYLWYVEERKVLPCKLRVKN
jgi:ATP-dependent exoDNAse (exonuclease V) beta subunit